MKILVLEGSPHKNGTSNTIAKSFIDGAKSAGHEIEVYDNGRGTIKPCLGCDFCGMNGKCVQKDGMNELMDKILSSDCLVFVTPIYYFGFSAQLKAIIDRFYAKNGAITRRHLKAIYIAAAWNDDNVVMSGISKHIDTISDYLEFDEVGRILAKGAGAPSMISKRYLDEAYNLGKNLK